MQEEHSTLTLINRIRAATREHFAEWLVIRFSVCVCVNGNKHRIRSGQEFAYNIIKHDDQEQQQTPKLIQPLAGIGTQKKIPTSNWVSGKIVHCDDNDDGQTAALRPEAEQFGNTARWLRV